MAEPAEEGPDADIIVLRADDGTAEAVEATPENRAKQEKSAKQRRAEFLFNKDGALARAGQLPRLLTGNLSAGVVNLMLVKIMQGELQPQTAKEAAEIAKITHGIFQSASGQTAGNLNLTKAERADRMVEVDKLQKELELRAAAATEQLGGAPQDGEDVPEPEVPEPDEWDHDDQAPEAAPE